MFCRLIAIEYTRDKYVSKVFYNDKIPTDNYSKCSIFLAIKQVDLKRFMKIGKL